MSEQGGIADPDAVREDEDEEGKADYGTPAENQTTPAESAPEGVAKQEEE